MIRPIVYQSERETPLSGEFFDGLTQLSFLTLGKFFQ